MSEKKINLEEARQAFEIAATEHSQEFELFFLSKLYGLNYFYTDKTCEITFEPKGFSFNLAINGSKKLGSTSTSLFNIIKYSYSCFNA
jgi:hypothetical protein